tara:strand:- start:196 stop:375 length:180 start_codon:yes stop_codon:yes gene_type:complete
MSCRRASDRKAVRGISEIQQQQKLYFSGRFNIFFLKACLFRFKDFAIFKKARILSHNIT